MLERAVGLEPVDPTITEHLGDGVLANRPQDRGAVSVAARADAQSHAGGCREAGGQDQGPPVRHRGQWRRARQ